MMSLIPTVYGPANATQEATYIVFLIDEDVDTGTGPRVQLLHYFQPDLVGINHVLDIVDNAQNATTAVGAPYITPSPPGGDIAHRYNVLLYVQPEGFTVPPVYAAISPPADVSARYPFNMSGFADAAGRGQPIAANWFRVINETTTATGSSSTNTASATSTAADSSDTATSTPAAAGTPVSASASSSASASASSSATGAAGLMSVRGSLKELVAGLVVGVAGAWLWML